jgi:LysM repeat protein
MAYANGRIPASDLTKVQANTTLSKPTAVAWFALKAAAKKELGRTISIAGTAGGGGYRSYAMQDAMHNASISGNAALKARWDLNPNSSVPLAAAGGSTHGLGTRVDIVGTVMDQKFFDLAKRFGFTREFGPRDPNHFMHDGKTAIHTTVVKKAASKVTAAKKVTYTIKSGDTLTEIAEKHSTGTIHLTVAKLLTLNPGVVATKLKIGQKLKLN